eukprot:5002716-Pyramimonas_sp.AAC.1
MALQRFDISPELMREKPNEAAKILWLLRRNPPFGEVLRSDLFKISDEMNVMAEAQSITPKLTHSEVLKSMFYSHGPSNLRPAYYNLHIVMSGNEEPRTRTNYLRADQGPVFYRYCLSFLA